MNDGQAVMHDTVDEVFKNASLLKEIGLSVPAVTDVMLSLKSRGLNLSTNVYTVDKAAEVLLNVIKGGVSLDQ